MCPVSSTPKTSLGMNVLGSHKMARQPTRTHRLAPRGNRVRRSAKGTTSMTREWGQVSGETSNIPTTAAANARSRSVIDRARHPVHATTPTTVSWALTPSALPTTGAYTIGITQLDGVGANSRSQNAGTERLLHQVA